MKYRLHKSESYPSLRMADLGKPLEERIISGIRNRIPGLVIERPARSDFAISNANYLLSRMSTEDYPTLGRYVGAIMSLFRRAEFCSVGILPKNSSKVEVPPLEHRLTVRREGEYLSMDEEASWGNERLRDLMDATFIGKRPMFIDRGLPMRVMYDDLDPLNSGCEIFPLARGEAGRVGALALMPFYYREQADPCGLVAFAGDLRCKGSGIDGFWGAFWSARLAMASASQISDKLAHKFDAITILTKYEDFEVDLRSGIREIIEDGERNTYLIMIDIDDFKKVNDRHGYEAGNDILRGVAERIKESVRNRDLVSRWGGEEFAVILKDVSGREEANQIAERIRRNVEETSVLVPSGQKSGSPAASASLSWTESQAASEPRGWPTGRWMAI